VISLLILKQVCLLIDSDAPPGPHSSSLPALPKCSLTGKAHPSSPWMTRRRRKLPLVSAAPNSGAN